MFVVLCYLFLFLKVITILDLFDDLSDDSDSDGSSSSPYQKLKKRSCQYCKTSFSRSDNLKRHENRCKRAVESLSSVGTLNRKRKLYLPDENSGKIQKVACRYCDLSISRKDNLIRHEKNCISKKF